MTSKSKKLRARMASQRAKLTFEHLEARTLLSVSPSAMPMVYSGSDMVVGVADGAVISGEVIANAPSNLSMTWSLRSGPGSAAFSDPGSPSTTVTFSQAGTYELELTAENGGATASDLVTITVEGLIPEGTVYYLSDETQFTGNNDHVEVPHDDVYLLDEGAVAFWFKADSSTIKQGLFSKDSGGFDTGGHLSIHLESDGRVNVRLQSTSTTKSIFTNSTISSDTWHHVALNFGPGGMSLYLDGVLEQSSSYTGGLGTSSGGVGNYEPIVLGASSWGSGDLQATPVELPLQGGAIDEVVIVDHALSTQEISALLSAPIGDPIAPVASNGSWTTGEGVPINASVTATDANSDPLAYILVGSVSNGVLDFNGDGSFTYTPNASFVGTDTFTFKANDGGLDSNIATVTITVQELSDEEVLATNNPLSVTEGATGTITSALLSTTDTDNTPAELTYSITSGPGNGTMLLSGSATSTFTQADINAGLITYQHSGDESTSDSFGFTVNDAQGPGTSGTFSINVTPVNDEEVLASNNALSVSEGAAATISSTFLRTTDADNTPIELVYTITGGTGNGTILLSGSVTTTFTQADIDTGLITYQHDGSQTTSDSFTFTVDDGQGTTTGGTFAINVTQAGQNVINIDQAWLDAQGNGNYLLDQQGYTYVLQTDVTVNNGTAFIISADNVVFDGNNHTITYSNTGAGTGITINNASNVEIKNLTLQQGTFSFNSGGAAGAISGTGSGKMNFHDLTFNLIARRDARGMHGIELDGVAIGSGSEIHNSTFNITGENGMKIVDGGTWLFHDNVVTATNLKRTGTYARLLDGGNNSEYYNNTITVDSNSQYVNIFIGYGTDNVIIHDNIINFASRHGRIIKMDDGCDGWEVYNNLITVTSQNTGDEVTYVIRIRDDNKRPSTNHEIYNNTIDATNAMRTTAISIGGGSIYVSDIRVHHNILKSSHGPISFYGDTSRDVDFYRNEVTYTGTGNGYAIKINESAHSNIVFSHNTISGGNPDGKLVRASQDLAGTGAVTICGSPEVTVATLNVASASDFVLTNGPCQHGENDTAPIGYQAPANNSAPSSNSSSGIIDLQQISSQALSTPNLALTGPSALANGAIGGSSALEATMESTNAIPPNSVAPSNLGVNTSQLGLNGDEMSPNSNEASSLQEQSTSEDSFDQYFEGLEITDLESHALDWAYPNL